jgi:hypothetical protein
MTKEVQFRRGTTTQHSTFTGALAEVTVDTDLDVVVVHDGVTAGGQQMVGRTATQTLTNKTLTSPTISGGTINNASVGASVRSSGAFTTLDANGNVILGSDTADTVTVNGLINSAVTFTGGTSHLTMTGELRGPATFIIDPAAVGDNTGTVQIKGNLQVDGDTTTVNSVNYTVDDPLIVLADGQTTLAGVNTGGFTLGTTGVGIQYNNGSTRFDCTEDLNLANGKAYEINGTVVLSSSAVLGKTIGGTATGDIVSIDGTQTLSNKTLTAPKFVDNGFLADTNGNEVLQLGLVASATTQVKISNAITGTTGPVIESAGETNVDLRIRAAGTGDIVLSNMLKPAAGTTSKSPLLFTTGSLLTGNGTAGAMEYVSQTAYYTPALNQRGALVTPQYYVLNAARVGPTTTGTFSLFGVGTSLVAGRYEYELVFTVTKTSATGSAIQYAFTTTAGTVTAHRYSVWSMTAAAQTTPTAAQLMSNYITTGFNTLVTVTPTGAAAASAHVQVIKGFIDVSVDVTGFNPQFGFTGIPTTSSILERAYMRIWPIGATGANTSIGNWA